MKQYSEAVKKEVREQIAAGRSQREVSREYGISRYSIQSWCGLRPETKLREIAPLPKGRPKASINCTQENGHNGFDPRPRLVDTHLTHRVRGTSSVIK